MKQLLSYLQQDLPAGLQLLEQMVNMESPSNDKALVDQSPDLPDLNSKHSVVLWTTFPPSDLATICE